MNVHVLPVGMLQTNCYILASEQKNALVIDPGGDDKAILRFLEREGLALKVIVLTHGHFDHMGGVFPLWKATAAAVWVPQGDEDIFLKPLLAGSSFPVQGIRPSEEYQLYGDSDEIALDELTLRALYTPGHTKGSSVLVGDGVIFSGDTLFAGDIGRTDLYGGDPEAMRRSLQKIAALTGDYRLFPGHGEASTLAAEKRTNPYLGTNYDDIF